MFKISSHFSLGLKVLIGMIIGCAIGNLAPQFKNYAHLGADIYIKLIKMIIVPTIFCALVTGITSVEQASLVKKLSLKAAGVYLFFTISAVLLGLSLGSIFKPGLRFILPGAATASTQVAAGVKALAPLLLDVVPENPVAALAYGHILQVVLVAVLFGTAIVLVGDAAKACKDFMQSLNSVVFKIVSLVVQTTPYGVAAIMAWVIAQYGGAMIWRMGKLGAVILIAFLVQYGLFGVFLRLVKLKALPFYRKTLDVQSLALATSSSKATIGTAIVDLETKLGVSKTTANLVLPLGATINMSGSAIYIVICALFFAQSLSVTLSLHQYLVLILTATIGSIGAAGYPSGAVLMLGMVLPSIGLPIEGLPLIMGIDRLLDMFRTVVNVTGDCAATVIVDQLSNSLETQVYHSTTE